MNKIGVLVINTGTPDAPTPSAVRRYLREFLSDKRVVQLPRFIWLPILYGLVLPFRSRKSAKLYKKIWTPEDSPMRTIMQSIAMRLREKSGLPVEVGMNYGNPSIADGLEKLRAHGIEQVIVLPLFPQFSNTTTSSSFDRVRAALKQSGDTLKLQYIEHYYSNPSYIRALAASVKNTWVQSGQKQHLLISFHGIPQRFVNAGDPYAFQCRQTAQLLAAELQLTADKWTLCYQSQFGYDQWLLPSTQTLLTELPTRGIQDIDVICPGFSVDCLETLEEIVIRGTESFLQSGGKSLRYLRALNDTDAQIDVLSKIIEPMLR